MPADMAATASIMPSNLVRYPNRFDEGGGGIPTERKKYDLEYRFPEAWVPLVLVQVPLKKGNFQENPETRP